MFHKKIALSLFSVIAILTLAALACVGQSATSTAAPSAQKPKQTPLGVMEENPKAEAEVPQPSQKEGEYAPVATQMLLPAESARDGAAAGVVAPPQVPLPMPTLAPPNGKAYLDNFFENYGVNPFIDTEDDHFSTFALDVDSGSYTIARSYLNDGNLPEKDSVRVEEFVNYFEQGYKHPRHGQPFAIYLDGAETPYTESGKYQVIRVGVQGYSVSPEERQDVALTFVIDVSGSMDLENRLELVKRALELLVEQLRSSDSVSIVVYGSTARVVLQPTDGDDKGAIIEAIRSLYPEGATNAQAGLNLGYQMAIKAFKADGINRVILCSDGVANVGETGADEIWDTVKARASEGITLTTVGFGMGNYNDVLMEQLADNGNGFYAYVDTLKEARRLFVENQTSTLQAIAMNAKIQVDFNPETVARYRLIGFENRAVADEDFRNDKVDAGEIGAGHSVTALYEIKLHPATHGKIADVYLRWEDPQPRKVTEMQQTMFDEELASSFRSASPYFQWDVVVAEFAEILRQSYWAQNSSLASVLEEADRLSTELPASNDVDEFVRMLRTANRLAGDAPLAE